jgi:urease accessory protein
VAEAAGITASARIVAVRAPGDGVTRFPVLSSQVPLVLRRTPDAVYLVGGAAGPLGGDDLTLEIEVAAGAALRVRTAAAAVALPGRDGAESVLRLRARVGAGARLEYLPEPVVVADGARHRVEVAVSLAADATLLFRDEIVLGRHGERGGSCVSRLTADLGTAPLLRHEVAVSGMDEVSLGPAMLGGHRVFASLLSVGCGTDLTPGDDLAVMPLAAAPGAVLATALGVDAACRLRAASAACAAGSKIL